MGKSGYNGRGNTHGMMWARNRVEMSFGHNPGTGETSFAYTRKPWWNVYVFGANGKPLIIATLASKEMARIWCEHTDGISWHVPARTNSGILGMETLRAKLTMNSMYGKIV